MPRFYFDTRDDGRVMRDDAGFDLTGIDAVEALAVRSLAQIAIDILPASARGSIGVDVRDEAGAAVLTTELTFETRRLG
jgi:hypothetical protein